MMNSLISRDFFMPIQNLVNLNSLLLRRRQLIDIISLGNKWFIRLSNYTIL